MCGLWSYQSDATDLPDFDLVFKEIIHRGPDNTKVVHFGSVATLAFHRLAIMDTSHQGDQPLVDEAADVHVVCNGEIYNFPKLRAQYEKTYSFTSHSDCEVILPLYKEFGITKMNHHLDGEYAFVIWDNKAKKMLAGRDPIGIRPLFYGYAKRDGKIMFCSEAKGLVPFCDEVKPFPPGHYYDGQNFVCYRHFKQIPPHRDSHEIILKNIREKLIEGIRKRLAADVPIGFLLSGGLDSSLVCGIATKILNKKIITFSVGLDHNPIDIRYAKIVADYIKSDHHEVYFNKKDTLEIVPALIHQLETWDITTIRASIGMYLVCKYIHEKTKVKVLLTGEISDELFGYKYTDFAPNGEEFQNEAIKRIQELYMYDVLRADRCIAAHALEARVPFGDLDFVQYVMGIPGEKKLNTTGIGKFMLREAFKHDAIIPEDILWREKAAFSDAVGHSMVDYLKEHAEALYNDKDVAKAATKYPHGTPYTKESLWYRDLFEKSYAGQGKMIADFWLPNKTWANCNVSDPSARVLPNYGKSGV